MSNHAERTRATTPYRLAGLALVGMLIAGAAAAPAQTDPNLTSEDAAGAEKGDGTSEAGGLELWMEQADLELAAARADLNAVADEIDAFVGAHADWSGSNYPSGYAGVVIALLERQVLLYWKGSVPAEVNDFLDKLRVDHQDIIISSESAPYSLSELNRARALITSPSAGAPPITVRWHSLTVPPEGTSLEVGVAPIPGEDPSQVADRAKAELGAVAGVEVTVMVIPSTEPTTRLEDRSPFWAGARMVATITNGLAGALEERYERVCSTGFAVTKQVQNPTDFPDYLLTAAHCFFASYADDVLDGAGNALGTLDARSLDRPRDRALINVWPSLAAALRGESGSEGKTYVGGVITEESSKAIITYARRPPHKEAKTVQYKGWRETSVGIRGIGKGIICTSGSVTGSNCDLAVKDVNKKWIVNHPEPFQNALALQDDVVVGPGFTLQEYNGGVAVGFGDSGGPVYAFAENDARMALGIISGGGAPVRCGTYPLRRDPDWTNHCFNEVDVVPITLALEGTGATFKGWQPPKVPSLPSRSLPSPEDLNLP